MLQPNLAPWMQAQQRDIALFITWVSSQLMLISSMKKAIYGLLQPLEMCLQWI